MRVSSKIVVDIATGNVVERESCEYFGPLAECITGSGGSTKSKSKSQQQSTSETGTRYNPDFMTQATNYANDSTNAPAYNPQYVKGNYTSLAPGGFDKLESNLYDTQASKLSQAYNTAVGQQREQLAQTGARTGDPVFVSMEAPGASIAVQGAKVTATDVVSFYLANHQATTAVDSGALVGYLKIYKRSVAS